MGVVEALQRGRDCLSVKLADPSFNAPIYANLFDDEDGETFSLIWSRGPQAQRRLNEANTKLPPGVTGVCGSVSRAMRRGDAACDC